MISHELLKRKHEYYFDSLSEKIQVIISGVENNPNLTFMFIFVSHATLSVGTRVVRLRLAL